MHYPIINGGGEADVRQFGDDGSVLSQTHEAQRTNKKHTTTTELALRDTCAAKNTNNKCNDNDNNNNNKCSAPLDELWVSPTRSQTEPCNDM